MRELRLMTDDGAGAAEGLALDEALMGRYAAGPAAPTLRLYTYRTHCALVGRFQDARAELDLDACAATGTQVNRRPTGGGAIVMGRDQLGVALVASLADPITPAHARAIIARFGDGIVRGLARFGIHGEVRGKNDVAVAGRKIAGLGVYADARGAVLFHASVLVDLDVEFMLRALRIPIAKLADKAVASVRERITTVRAEAGSPTTDEVRSAVAAGFEESLGLRAAADELTDADRAAAARLVAERYGSTDWLLERAAPSAEGTSILKTPGGLLRVSLALGGDAIAQAAITGDFMGGDRAVAELEASLRWTGADLPRIAAALAEGARRGGGLEGVPVGDLAEAVWQAVLDARARRGATGSCYYPGGATAGRDEARPAEPAATGR